MFVQVLILIGFHTVFPFFVDDVMRLGDSPLKWIIGFVQLTLRVFKNQHVVRSIGFLDLGRFMHLLQTLLHKGLLIYMPHLNALQQFIQFVRILFSLVLEYPRLRSLKVQLSIIAGEKSGWPCLIFQLGRQQETFRSTGLFKHHLLLRWPFDLVFSGIWLVVNLLLRIVYFLVGRVIIYVNMGLFFFTPTQRTSHSIYLTSQLYFLFNTLKSVLLILVIVYLL